MHKNTSEWLRPSCHCKLARRPNPRHWPEAQPMAAWQNEAAWETSGQVTIGFRPEGNVGILKYYIDGFSQKPKNNEQFILFKGLHLLSKFDRDTILNSFHPEIALFRNLCVNLRNTLCGVLLVRLRVIP